MEWETPGLHAKHPVGRKPRALINGGWGVGVFLGVAKEKGEGGSSLGNQPCFRIKAEKASDVVPSRQSRPAWGRIPRYKHTRYFEMSQV